MKAKDAIPWLLLAAGGYVIYRIVSSMNKAKDEIAGTIADLWLKLFPMPPAMQVLGNVNFPGGISVPLQQLANERSIREDGDHNVFVKYADHVWQLSPSNAYGNWPATLVK